MPLLRHILSLVPGLAAALLFTVALREPLGAPPLFAAWLAVFLVSFIVISGKEARSGAFWFLAVPPVALVFGATAFLFLLENRGVGIGVAVGTSVLTALFGYTHFLFVRQPARYQPYALESLSLAANLAAFFLIGASILGYVSLLSLPQWVVASTVLGVAGLLVAETLWVSKVRGHRLPGLVFAGSLLLAEAAAALLLLPVSFLVAGAALAVTYYAVVGLLRAHALAACNTRVIQRYAGVALLAAVAIVGTARWI
ncbi:hypothetical protein EPO33_02865 [Patescibacteria group bacterium]|nr:MAG: hypothetical protein EPO33_02865 [Patescibacteria group bacterium]